MSPEKIPSWINELCSIFPCMVQRVQGNGFEINWGKVAQSLVVIAIIASSTSFVTVKVLESQFSDLKADMREDIKDIKLDIKSLEKEDSNTDKTLNEIASNVNKMEDRLSKLEDK